MTHFAALKQDAIRMLKKLRSIPAAIIIFLVKLATLDTYKDDE